MKYLRNQKKNILIGLVVILIVSIFYQAIFLFYAYSYTNPVGYEESTEEVLTFPENFLWGTATSAYQVEGDNVHSNWWRFEQTPGNIKNNDSAKLATDHYNRYEEDITLMKEFNLSTYRFSIEWSRIQPEKDMFRDDEIEHYRSVIAELKKNDIVPMVTIWHTSVPVWFEDAGGWEVAENVDHYVEYVRYVAMQLGDEVELWITMNEPLAYITTGYVSAKWPPGEQKFSAVPVLFKNLVNGHNRAYDAIHAVDHEAQVGIAEHSSYIVPNHKSNPIETAAAFFIDYGWTHFLVDLVKEHVDFLGVHYYYKQTIDIGLVNELLTADDISSFESESTDRAYFPQGLFEVLVKFKKYDVPLYITELGVPDWHEIDRDQFIRDHVRQIYYAIEYGVDVRGLYYWSLLDNFEWSEGYDAQFGLVAVDRETQDRTIKDSSWEYALIAGCSCVGSGN